MGLFDKLKNNPQEVVAQASNWIQQHSNPVNPPKEEEEENDGGGGGGSSNPVNPVGTIGQGGIAYKTGTVSAENNDAGSGTGVSENVADALKAQQEAAAQKAREQAEAAEAARQAEEARKAEEARQAEIARQQAEAQRRAQEEAARKQAEEQARRAEEARLAEIARQEELRRQAELARQEAIRRQQESTTATNQAAHEEVSQSATPAPTSAVDDAIAQTDANIETIQEQLNFARNNNSTEDILRLTEDLLEAQRHRQQLDAQARAIAGVGTTSTANPLTVAPQVVNNEYTQPTSVGVSNPLVNNFASTLLRPNDSRSSAFVKNAGRAVQEDEDEFWRPEITRDQFLEATSSLLNPLMNFGVRPAEGAYEPNSGGKRWDVPDTEHTLGAGPAEPGTMNFATHMGPELRRDPGTPTPGTTPAPQTTTLYDLENGTVDTNYNPATDFQTPASQTPANDPMAYWLSREYPAYTGGDWSPTKVNPEWTPANPVPNPLKQSDPYQSTLDFLNEHFPLEVPAPKTYDEYYQEAIEQGLPDPVAYAEGMVNQTPPLTNEQIAQQLVGLEQSGQNIDKTAGNLLSIAGKGLKAAAGILGKNYQDNMDNFNLNSPVIGKEAYDLQHPADINNPNGFTPVTPGATPNPNQNPFASLQSFNVTDSPENYADNTMRDIMGNRTFAGLPTFNLDDPFQTISPEDNWQLQDIYDALPEFWTEGEKGQFLYDAINNPDKGTVKAPDPGIIASMAPPSIDENGVPNYTLALLGRKDEEGHPIYDADTVFQAFADTSGEAMKDGGKVAWKQPVQDMLNDPTLTPEQRAGLNAILTDNWWAGDSKVGRDLYPRQYFDGTNAQYAQLAELLSKKLGLDYLMDEGVINSSDVTNFFLKAPASEKEKDEASSGSGGNGKPQTLPASYGQGDKVVKAPYRKGGYSAAELQAMGNSPYKDYRGYDAYEGYYYNYNDGQWYPVDQIKANYYNENYHSYRGWDEGMRDYYNTFGTFKGYTPTWEDTGRKSNGGSGGSYSRSSYTPRSYSYNNTYNNGSNPVNNSSRSYNYTRSVNTPSLTANTQRYDYGSSSSTPQYATQQRATSVAPGIASQRSNRVYNIMKNWSF